MYCDRIEINSHGNENSHNNIFISKRSLNRAKLIVDLGNANKFIK